MLYLLNVVFTVFPQRSKTLKSEVSTCCTIIMSFHPAQARPFHVYWFKKPDETFLPCTEFRKVIAIMRSDFFPLPHMDECVDRVGSPKCFSKFDLLKGY